MTTAPTITPDQRNILRHALGLDSLKPQDYGKRNHYVTDQDSSDYPDCERLVQLGLMTRHSKSWVPGHIYIATQAGMEQAKQ